MLNEQLEIKLKKAIKLTGTREIGRCPDTKIAQSLLKGLNDFNERTPRDFMARLWGDEELEI